MHSDQLNLEPPAEIVRSDCVECGDAIYHHKNGKDMHKCIERGAAVIWREDRGSHFIVFLEGFVAASCLPWNELDKSVEKMEKVG